MAIHDKLKNLLLKAGLSENEVAVYIELLQKPVQTVWELVGRTGLSKNAVYRAVARLQKLKMVEKTSDGLRALSLKNFVADLTHCERKLGKLAYQLQQVAPFLRVPHEAIEEFETFQTPDQIAEAYLFMAEQDFDVNFDFGDFESFIPKIGGVSLGMQFRITRAKRAKAHAICTTSGPHASYFSTSEQEKKFQCKVDFLKLNFDNRFIICSDRGDYVMFNKVEGDDVSATLVKSKMIADIQRLQFQNFSQQIGKL